MAVIGVAPGIRGAVSRPPTAVAGWPMAGVRAGVGRVPARGIISAVALVAACLVAMAALAAHWAPAVATSGQAAPVVAEGVAVPAWTVSPGDTLWGIAQALRPDVDPRITVERIREANGGDLQILQPGRVLLLPRM